MTDPYLILPVVFVFAGTFLAPVAGRVNLKPKVTGLVLCLFPLAAFLFILGRLPALEPDMGYVWQQPWVSGFWFSFYMDSLAAFFALLVTLIGTLVVVYAGYYFASDDGAWRFFYLYSRVYGINAGSGAGR